MQKGTNCNKNTLNVTIVFLPEHVRAFAVVVSTGKCSIRPEVRVAQFLLAL